MRWFLLAWFLCIPSSVESFADDRAAELRGGIDDDGKLRPARDGLSAFLGRPLVPPKPLVWEADYQAALARAKAEKRPLLILFRADWCKPCRTMEETTLSDPWIQIFLADFVLFRSNDDREMEKKFGVAALPSCFFLFEDGRVAGQVRGCSASRHFAGALVKALRGLDRKLPSGLQKLVDGKYLESRDRP